MNPAVVAQTPVNPLIATGVAGGGGLTVNVLMDETGLLQPVFTV